MGSDRSYLFVYGSLRRTGSHPMAGYLAGCAGHLGPAGMPGRLYDLGRYPGLIEPAQEGEWVHGEVYVLTDPDTILPVLDGYEGCDPQDGSTDLFKRRRTAVVLES